VSMRNLLGKFSIIILSIFYLLQCSYAGTLSMNNDTNQLIIIYDNNLSDKDLTAAWGFSCLIILPQYRILFDTGGDPSILLENMHKMEIDPEKIDSVVLSHVHGDHAGGLKGLLGQHRRHVTVYLPESFPRGYKEEASFMGADVKDVKNTMMINKGVYTTGQLGKGIKEQSLILKTREGLVIITGCAHPGIVEIVEHVRKFFKENIYLLIGGFHLMNKSPGEINNIAEQLDKLGVERIAPCHCSGDNARKLFRQHYGKNYIECGAGLVIEIPDIKK
jgi:7,8-dihydropterin-6-yl-methyl-4-(beta-D-ribofuranosyl)aminobenzene 5'-phosphate synthase